MNIFENKEEQGIFHLGIDEISTAYLQETSRWGKFLAILALICVGLLLVFGMFMGMFVSQMVMSQNPMASTTAPLFTGIFIISAVIYTYPVWCLFKFSTLMKRALNTANQEQFNEALRYQKNMFKFIGILVIIMLVLYGVAIIFMIIDAAMAM